MFCHVLTEFFHGKITLADGAILHQNFVHYLGLQGSDPQRKMGVVLGFDFVFGLL